MNERLESTLTIAAALGSGMTAGLLFIFSVAVMPALARLQPASGIAAMQSINEVIQNPVFFLVFFGPALLGIGLCANAFLGGQGAASATIIAATLFYVIGTIGITIVFNVPMNDALVAVDPSSTQGASVWSDYLSRWTLWNHVRTVAGVLATCGFMLALR